MYKRQNNIPSVSLEELNKAALLNRVDTKYILNQQQFNQLFASIPSEYKILEINNHRVFNYLNNYFDTINLDFYFDRHKSYPHRIKVRSRKYIEMDKSFFEIKKKEKITRTNKHRKCINEILTTVSTSNQKQVQNISNKKIDELEYVLQNKFKRITLVDDCFKERITIDCKISYQNSTKKFELNNIAIVEIKKSKGSESSTIANYFRHQNIRKQSFSKYIMGVIMLHPNIKKNNFLPILKNLNKIEPQWNK